jgi:MFS family permease
MREQAEPAPDRAGTAGGRRFWIVAATSFLYLFAASAPSPLYGVYAATWHFSPTTLTAVFGVYALALLTTMLITGSLSDAIGRRPVVVAALVLQALAMAAFIAADNVGWLYVARIVQGAATGLVTAAISAALVDLQPPGKAGLAALVNATIPPAGLAAGALVAGALVQYAPAPMRLVYWVLLAVFAVLTAVVLTLVPETVTERRTVSLAPRVGVERSVRGAFLAAMPALIACWALGGLYLSLGPSLVQELAHTGNALTGGVVVFLLCGAGALAGVLVRGWSPRLAMLAGCAALAGGVAVTVAAVAAEIPALLYAGTVVAGCGFGVAFLGSFRTLVALASPQRRGELIAAIYIVAYLAFSVPSVIAGVLTTSIGLNDAATGYGVVVALLALAALPATARPTTHSASPAPARR